MLSILVFALAVSCLPSVFSTEALVVQLSRISINNDEIKGLLDIRYRGKWGNICYWSYTFSSEAEVACRQLGYLGVGYTKYTVGWQRKGIVNRISCSGAESRLDECNIVGFPPYNCSVRHDYMVVKCRKNPALNGFLNATLLGRNAHMGILEVASKNGKKAAVCFDLPANNTVTSKTVCAQMGYSDMQTTLATNQASYTGRNFVSVDCRGTQPTLAACSMTSTRSCPSATLLGVECKLDMATQQMFDIRLSPADSYPKDEGTVEVYRYGRWGVICDTGWDMNAAQVVCRQLGFRQAINATKNAVFGQGTGLVFWSNVQCNGEEPSLAECKHDVAYEKGVCHSVNASGVVCSNESLPTINICSNSLHALTPGVQFIRSPTYPESFKYYTNGITCYVNLTSPSNFTVYIHNKMFQNNHVEYLSFITSDVTDIFYGEDSAQKSVTYNTDRMTVVFQASIWTGKLKLNIGVTVPVPGSTAAPTTLRPTTAAPTTLRPTTAAPTTLRPTTAVTPPLIKAPHGDDEAPGMRSGVVVGLIVLVIIIAIAVIIGISLWKKGFIHFGRMKEDSNRDFDAAAIQGVTTIESCERIDNNSCIESNTVNRPIHIYENSTFLRDSLDHMGDVTTESSEDHRPAESDYEDARDLNSLRRYDTEDYPASRPTEVVLGDYGPTSDNAGESPYAHLDQVNRSEYLDFRQLSAEQVRPI
ncbi:deleted in malignant brain tumors 1 protein-like [Lineus longissimus]|uniref:deleted in malignant brain tumors 1 protein-like n=1 Tax=Lineus longissimus TaxID=88925 RepID=UPI00315DDE25